MGRLEQGRTVRAIIQHVVENGDTLETTRKRTIQGVRELLGLYPKGVEKQLTLLYRSGVLHSEIREVIEDVGAEVIKEVRRPVIRVNIERVLDLIMGEREKRTLEFLKPQNEEQERLVKYMIRTQMIHEFLPKPEIPYYEKKNDEVDTVLLTVAHLATAGIIKRCIEAYQIWQKSVH